MKTWILPVGAAALATLLAVAALSPDATREILRVPKGWIEARRTAALQTQTRAEWADIDRRARSGDPDAMHRLGTKMLFWSNEEWTGVPTDFAAGLKLIRSAADAGHVDAELVIWQIDGKDPDQLKRIANKALERVVAHRHQDRLSDWLRWTALQECDASVRRAAARVNAAIGADLNQHARYESFQEAYDQRCRLR